MKKAFVIYGTAICLLFAYASWTRWAVIDSFKPGNWGPKGQNVYHK